MRLAEALEQTATAALRRMASAHGLLHDEGTTRAELIERLAERLLDRSYLEEQLRGLTEDELAALGAVRAGGGELRGLLVDRDHPGATEALVERGLLFRIFAAAGPLRGELFAAPDELLAQFPQPPPIEGPPPGVVEPAPPERRLSDPAFSLFCIASALNRPASNLEDEVGEWSAEPGGWAWDARWTFLRHVAQAVGLIVHQADGALVPGQGLARLLDDPGALSERLWRAYVHDRGWSDLAQSGVEDGADIADSRPLRESVLGALEELPSDSWVELEAISDWLQRTRPMLVREQLSARGLVALEAADWSALEQRLVRYLLLGPLYWLGVVVTTSTGLLVARRAHARSRKRIKPEACQWEGAELVAPARAALGTLLEAERYLLLHQRGRPSRYQLLQSHVASTLGSGGSIGESRRLLVALTQGDLPTLPAERLSAWEKRFGALTIRPTVVVEARSAADLDKALADERVRSFVRQRLAPMVAEVAAADALQLAAALRAADHLPRVDAALRLAAEPRRAYAGLVDEQVLEFLLVNLLAFSTAWPERLADLEGSQGLLERLERQFPPERLAALRAAAARLAGDLTTSPKPPPRRRRRRTL